MVRDRGVGVKVHVPEGATVMRCDGGLGTLASTTRHRDLDSYLGFSTWTVVGYYPPCRYLSVWAPHLFAVAAVVPHGVVISRLAAFTF